MWLEGPTNTSSSKLGSPSAGFRVDPNSTRLEGCQPMGQLVNLLEKPPAKLLMEICYLISPYHFLVLGLLSGTSSWWHEARSCRFDISLTQWEWRRGLMNCGERSRPSISKERHGGWEWMKISLIQIEYWEINKEEKNIKSIYLIHHSMFACEVLWYIYRKIKIS